MENKGTYGYIISCDNCGYKKLVYIPKGKLVKEFTTELAEECPRCGFEDCWKGMEAL